MRKRPGSNGVLSGLAIGPGVAVGPVFGTQEAPAEITRSRIAAADIEAEGARLEAAIAVSRKQLGKLRSRLAVLPEDSPSRKSPRCWTPMCRCWVRPGCCAAPAGGSPEALRSAEQAVMDESEAIAGALIAASPDDVDAAGRRADEVREIARRLVRNLTRAPFRSFAGLPPGAVLVAEWLTPADAALLDPARIAAVATEEGGLDGHTAVMLRALGIPTVLGVMGLTAHMEPGRLAVVDGTAGIVVLDPSPATLVQAHRAVIAFARRRQRWGRLRRLPAVTLCGTEMALQANLELARRIAADRPVRRPWAWACCAASSCS